MAHLYGGFQEEDHIEVRIQSTRAGTSKHGLALFAPCKRRAATPFTLHSLEKCFASFTRHKASTGEPKEQGDHDMHVGPVAAGWPLVAQTVRYVSHQTFYIWFY